MALLVKNLPANAGDIRDAGLIPGSGRSRGGGHGNPLQYSWLGNPMDKGACWATVLSVAELNTTEVILHACMHAYLIIGKRLLVIQLYPRTMKQCVLIQRVKTPACRTCQKSWMVMESH